MVETDLTDYFRQLCQQSEWSLHEIEDVVHSTENEPQRDVAAVTNTRSQTADDRKRADTTHGNGSDRWQEFRDQWRTHVAKLRGDTSKRLAELDAAGAAHYADEAELDAQDAIGHALDAIEEAEESVVNALRARARAEKIASAGTSHR